MTKRYTDKMLAEVSDKNSAFTREWFADNIPDAAALTFNTYYNEYSLYSYVTGTYRKDNKLIDFVLDAQSGRCLTNEYTDLLKEGIIDTLSKDLGVDKERLRFQYGISAELETALFEQRERGSSQYNTIPVSITFENMLPHGLNENDIADMLSSESLPRCSINVYLDSLDNIEADFKDLTFIRKYPDIRFSFYDTNASSDTPIYYALFADREKAVKVDTFVLLKYYPDKDNKYEWTIISEEAIDPAITQIYYD